MHGAFSGGRIPAPHGTLIHVLADLADECRVFVPHKELSLTQSSENLRHQSLSAGALKSTVLLLLGPADRLLLGVESERRSASARLLFVVRFDCV